MFIKYTQFVKLLLLLHIFQVLYLGMMCYDLLEVIINVATNAYIAGLSLYDAV
jgi:hypothetical protein